MQLDTYYKYYIRYFAISKLNFKSTKQNPQLLRAEINVAYNEENAETLFWNNLLLTGRIFNIAITNKEDRETGLMKIHLTGVENYNVIHKYTNTFLPYADDSENTTLLYQKNRQVIELARSQANIYPEPANIVSYLLDTFNTHLTFYFSRENYNQHSNLFLLRALQMPVTVAKTVYNVKRRIRRKGKYKR